MFVPNERELVMRDEERFCWQRASSELIIKINPIAQSIPLKRPILKSFFFEQSPFKLQRSIKSVKNSRTKILKLCHFFPQFLFK